MAQTCSVEMNTGILQRFYMIVLVILSFISFFPAKINKTKAVNNKLLLKSVDLTYNNNLFSIPNEDIKECDEVTKDESSHQIAIKNCIFRKKSFLTGNENALYISTNKFLESDENNNEIVIENNYYETCGISGYINIVDSKKAIFNNNTYNFSETESICGAIQLSKGGNITIFDCHFISMSTTGIILFQPNSQSLESNFLFIENCTFTNCNKSCVLLESHVESSETVIFCNCIFNRCHFENLISFSGNHIIIFNIEKSKFNMCSNFIEILDSISETNIDECSFLNCYNNAITNENDNWNAILINSGPKNVSITNCIFTNCGNEGYVIKVFGSSVNFINCSFEFDNIEISCCALDIVSNELVRIEECIFIRNKNTKSESLDSGTLHYHPSSPKAPLTFILCSFIECSGNKYKTFSIITNIEPDISCITVNNTGSIDNPSQDFICRIHLINVNKFTLLSCSFNNNCANSNYGGGSGIQIDSDLENTPFILEFQSCKWTNNYAIFTNEINRFHNGIGGALQYGSLDSMTNVILTFDSCRFFNNRSDLEGGGIAIQTTKEAFVRKCYFKKNKAGIVNHLQILEYTNEARSGGAIYIDPDFKDDDLNGKMPSFNIEQCLFEQNEGIDGHAIYIRRGIATQLNINDNTVFTDNGQSKSTILIESDDSVIDLSTIFNSTYDISSYPYSFGLSSVAKYENFIFDNITASNDPEHGNAIDLIYELLDARIKNCTFRNCGITGYAITCYSLMFTIENCTITFDDPLKATKGLATFDDAIMTIENCIFQRCFNADSSTGGGLYINPTTEVFMGSILINNVIFDENCGEDYRCFKIRWPNTDFVYIDRIAIINSPESGYTSEICFYESYDFITFDFNEWIFHNNTIDKTFSGGSGILIIDSENPGKMKLNFKGCKWTKNHAVCHKNNDGDYYNGIGGAFQIRLSQSDETDLLFEFCEFENNVADTEGGALAVQTTSNSIIQNCIFKGNIAGNSKQQSYGGAIFIGHDILNDIQPPIMSIENCFFESNIASSNGHAISILGNDANISIKNTTFSNNGKNLGSELYLICPSIKIEDSTFLHNIIELKSRAIEFESLDFIIFSNILFEDYKINGNDGGAIYMKPPKSTSTKLLTESNHYYEIIDCQFINCEAKNGGSIFIENDVNSVSFTNTTFNGGSISGEGIAIFISENVRKIQIQSAMELINQNCQDKFLISSSCQIININNLEIKNSLFGSGIKGFQFNQGTVNIENIQFLQLTTCIEINQNVYLARIENCTFSDCYCQNENVNLNQVVLISNKQCIFTNNTIAFKLNTQSISGLCVNSHGNIEITYNQFINISKSYNLMAGIQINETHCDEESGTVLFNYNLIKNVFPSNSQFTVLYITKKHLFNIDHNIIQDCKKSYLSQIDISSNNELGHELILSNLSLINCESNSKTGGDFDHWIQFKLNNGKLTLKNCLFENNYAGSLNNKKYFELFESNQGSPDLIELLIENSTFIKNKSLFSGGALSLQDYHSINICDCQFIENSADVGGAVYITKMQHQSEIKNCTFKDNNSKEKGGCLLIHTNSPFKICECQFLNNSSHSGCNLYIETVSGSNFCESITIINNVFNDIIDGPEKYDWCSIYLAGENPVTKIIIKNNEFIIKKIDEMKNTNLSIILTEICNISFDQITSENNFTIENGSEDMNLFLMNCKPTQLSNSNELLFTSSGLFTASDTLMINTIEHLTTTQFNKKISYSKSYSLSYTNRRSVSFSMSYFSSNTFEIVYDSQKNTYTVIITQTNYQSFFPYIINILSPIYVERSVTIDLTVKKTISPEQLIGVVCGSASVFFLILGVIILVVRRRNEIYNQIDELYDLSNTSDSEVVFLKNENNQMNSHDNGETSDVNPHDYSEIFI